jgi:hypothetical protein
MKWYDTHILLRVPEVLAAEMDLTEALNCFVPRLKHE